MWLEVMHGDGVEKDLEEIDENDRESVTRTIYYLDSPTITPASKVQADRALQLNIVW